MSGAAVGVIPFLCAGELVIGLSVWGVWGDCGPLKTLISSGKF